MTTDASVRAIVAQSEARVLAAINANGPLLVKGDGTGRPADVDPDEWASHAARWYTLAAGELVYVPNREVAGHLVVAGVTPKGFNADGPYPHVWDQGVIDELWRNSDHSEGSEHPVS